MSVVLSPSGLASQYLGIPYRAGGRSREGVDCLGLVMMVLADVRGIALHGYPFDRAGCAQALAAEVDAGTWRRITDAPQVLDVAVVTTKLRPAIGGPARAWPLHLGVSIGAHCLLHVEAAPPAQVVVVDLSADHAFAGRIDSWWRHSALDAMISE